MEEKNFKVILQSKNPIINETYEFDVIKDREYLYFLYRLKSLMKIRNSVLGVYSKAMRKEYEKKEPYKEKYLKENLRKAGEEIPDGRKNKNSIYDNQLQAETQT